MGEVTILLLFSISGFFPSHLKFRQLSAMSEIHFRKQRMWYHQTALCPYGEKKKPQTQNIHPAALLVVKTDHMVTRVNRSFKKVFFNSKVMRGVKGQ